MAIGDYISSREVNFEFETSSKLRSHGGELIINWQMADSVFAEFGYSYSDQVHYRIENDLLDANGKLEQLYLMINATPIDHHSFVAQLRVEDGDFYNVDDYASLNLTWLWQLNSNVNVSVVGRNLTESSHLEFARTNELFDIPTFIDRSFTIGVEVDF